MAKGTSGSIDFPPSETDGVGPYASVLESENITARHAFEEEYYELRDENKLARGADGYAMGPDEYVALKIAELDARTPESETVSIPDATQKEVLTALQKSINAERERIQNQPGAETEPVQDQATAETPGTAVALTSVRSRLGSLREKLTGKASEEDTPKLSAAELYELRAKGIAEKNGMGDHFKEVRFIRQAYIDARAAIGKDADKEKVKELKLSYDRALYRWRRDIEQKTGGLSGLEKAELLVVAKRDTILGPANAEIEARERALTEKGKTAFGKVQNWAAQAPLAVLKGLNFVPTVIGQGFAGVFNRDAYQPNAKMSPERYRELAAMTPKQREALSSAAQQDAARNYARAARIIAGAGIATFVAVAATPTVGVLMPFVVFAARGVAGTIASVGGAKLGGMGFDFFNKNRRRNLKDFTTATPADLAAYQAQQKAYMKNNARRRATEKMAVQMTSAILTGAGTGILSSGVSHSILERFGGLSSVKEAAKTVAEVNAHSPGAGPEAMRVGAAMKAASEHQTPVSATSGLTEALPVRVSAPTAPEGLLSSVSIKPGEGFGQLLVDLRHHVLGLENPPAGLKHFLEQNPNTLTHRLGVADGDGSLRMHAGDKLFIDAKQNVWLQAQGQEHPALVFQRVPVSAEAPDGYRVEPLDIKKFGGELQQDAVRPRVPQARAVSDASSAPRAADVPTEDPSAALNRGQVGSTVVDTGATASETFPAHPSADVPAEDVPATGDTQVQASPTEQPVAAPKLASDVALEQPVKPVSASEQSTVSAPLPEETLSPKLAPYINVHNVEVTPAIPAVYTIPGPNNTEVLYMYGGSSDESFFAAVKYVELHPGSSIRYFAVNEDTVTGVRTPYTGMFTSTQAGKAIGIVRDPETGEFFSKADPQTFIRRTAFDYSTAR